MLMAHRLRMSSAISDWLLGFNGLPPADAQLTFVQIHLRVFAGVALQVQAPREAYVGFASQEMQWQARMILRTPFFQAGSCAGLWALCQGRLDFPYDCTLSGQLALP